MSLKNWYFPEACTMDDKEYPFLQDCFADNNATVLVKTVFYETDQKKSSLHPQYHELHK